MLLKKCFMGLFVAAAALTIAHASSASTTQTTASSQHQVVYFTMLSPRHSLVAPLVESLDSANIVSDWKQVEMLGGGIDALVIDNTTLLSVDRNWVASAYQRGIVIAGINTPSLDFATVINNPCGNAEFKLSGDFYVVAERVLLAEDPDDVAKIEAAESQCSSETVKGITGVVVHEVGSSSGQLSSDKDYAEFDAVLNAYMASVDSATETFQKALAR